MSVKHSSEVTELLRSLRSRGYTISMGGRNHYKIRSDQAISFLPCSPSDHRSLLNACAELRRRGFEFTFRGKEYRQ